MFFIKKKIDSEKNSYFIKIAALLIHAAKIDENYSLEEKNIIKQTLAELGASADKLNDMITTAKIIENDSNQILSFTKKVKNMDNENKIQIIEALWKIIYSNNNADIYETNLMRRLAGLLYIDNKIMGDIKERVRKENS